MPPKPCLDPFTRADVAKEWGPDCVRAKDEYFFSWYSFVPYGSLLTKKWPRLLLLPASLLPILALTSFQNNRSSKTS